MSCDEFLATGFGQLVMAICILGVLVVIALVWADWTEPIKED